MEILCEYQIFQSQLSWSLIIKVSLKWGKKKLCMWLQFVAFKICPVTIEKQQNVTEHSNLKTDIKVSMVCKYENNLLWVGQGGSAV